MSGVFVGSQSIGERKAPGKDSRQRTSHRLTAPGIRKRPQMHAGIDVGPKSLSRSMVGRRRD
jgi:hypothetical protein